MQSAEFNTQVQKRDRAPLKELFIKQSEELEWSQGNWKSGDQEK